MNDALRLNGLSQGKVSLRIDAADVLADALYALGNAIYEAAKRAGIANSDHRSLSVPPLLHLLDCLASNVTPASAQKRPTSTEG